MSPPNYNYIQRDNQRFFKDSAIPVIEYRAGIKRERTIERPIFSQIPFYFHGNSVIVADGKYFPKTICCVKEG